ncbi:tat pathway signal sequence, partial [Mycolicibacterium diernhoferi]
LRLSAADRHQMAAMLRSSDNDAADDLWSRYGGPANVFNVGFLRYGMASVRPQPGFGDVYPYWGFQKGTADDFDALMNYVLTGLTPANAAAVIAEMQRVDRSQQWGVWGAGSAMSPGNKNGWSQEEGGWVVNSVGFAGPGQRYTLAIMNALGGRGGYDDGVQTTTEVARILLGPSGG